MDMSTPGDCFRIDDLLDFSSNQHLIITTSSNSSSTQSQSQSHHLPPPQHPFPHHLPHPDPFFTNLPSVPSDEAAELEWLSHFVDDTFHDFPPNQTMEIKSDTDTDTSSFPKSYNNVPSSCSSKVRRCSHCASEKTPQWRTGPLGPKTLCNACGVRFKSGRLVPEYRPASSPTFVLTQHSNSHRKVMELRRQKELLKHKQQEEQCYHFKVC